MNNEIQNTNKINIKSVGILAAGLGLVGTLSLVIYKKFIKKNEEETVTVIEEEK